MSAIEFLIIYLAAGAPFGAYFFVQNRHAARSTAFYLELAANFLFWFQYAVRLSVRHREFRRFFDSLFDRKVVSDSVRAREIVRIRGSLESALQISHPDFRIFEFRELFDRFAGLADEVRNASDRPADSVREFLGITDGPVREVSARVHQRRRLDLLRFHLERSRSELEGVIYSAFGGKRRIASDLEALFLLFGEDSATLPAAAANRADPNAGSADTVPQTERLRAA
jgi:hypothetical protein